MTPRNFDDMFNVNVRGLYFQLQSLLPVLANPSSVVLTSSIAAQLGMATATIYAATKAAVVSLGKDVLAVELALARHSRQHDQSRPDHHANLCQTRPPSRGSEGL